MNGYDSCYFSSALKSAGTSFIVLAVAFFGFAFYRLYLKSAACSPDAACASPQVRRRQRIAFWITLVFAHALVLSPYYASYLLG